MSRTTSQAYKHMRSALALWPKDNLRPETQFSEIIQRGIERRYTKPNVVDEAKELKQANAMFALTDDRFKKRFPLNGELLKPESQPTYFQDLLRELEEAPTRGWLQNMSKKLSGMNDAKPNYHTTQTPTRDTIHIMASHGEKEAI
ncbi:uncharacterized protein CLUP02_07056 [Colletotrichum lupini]|uniref:Uncharacterized protein n=1 Tax=Colletotrichum lupini TaxID=145971 RepID=A0A9Q8SQJ1_9PEZI|nr:uncharacterized protein CLUP02_07056 [Colletotrichum lupini]UQC81570.1 hypothetical protein CLUP02_07056 [Colletotrichum lupini]